MTDYSKSHIQAPSIFNVVGFIVHKYITEELSDYIRGTNYKATIIQNIINYYDRIKLYSILERLFKSYSDEEIKESIPMYIEKIFKDNSSLTTKELKEILNKV